MKAIKLPPSFSTPGSGANPNQSPDATVINKRLPGTSTLSLDDPATALRISAMLAGRTGVQKHRPVRPLGQAGYNTSTTFAARIHTQPGIVITPDGTFKEPAPNDIKAQPGNVGGQPTQPCFEDLRAVISPEQFKAAAQETFPTMWWSNMPPDQSTWYKVITEAVIRSFDKRSGPQAVNTALTNLFDAVARQVTPGPKTAILDVFREKCYNRYFFDLQSRAPTTPPPVAHTSGPSPAQIAEMQVQAIVNAACSFQTVNVTSYSQIVVEQAREILRSQHEIGTRIGGDTDPRCPMTTLEPYLIGKRANQAIEQEAQRIVQRVLADSARGERSTNVTSLSAAGIARAREILRSQHEIGTRIGGDTDPRCPMITLEPYLIGKRAQIVIDDQTNRIVQSVLATFNAGQRTANITGLNETAVAAAIQQLRAQHDLDTQIEEQRDHGGRFFYLVPMPIGQRLQGILADQKRQLQAAVDARIQSGKKQHSLAVSSFAPSVVNEIKQSLEDKGYSVQITNSSTRDPMTMDFTKPTPGQSQGTIYHTEIEAEVFNLSANNVAKVRLKIRRHELFYWIIEDNRYDREKKRVIKLLEEILANAMLFEDFEEITTYINKLIKNVEQGVELGCNPEEELSKNLPF